jgi:hypothetical protein
MLCHASLGLRVLHQLQAGIGSQNDEAVK